MPYDRWFLNCLYLTLFCLTVWIPPANANVLKDVRVGEYENFTRIVFELETDANATLNMTPQSDQVRIDFPDTRPDLIRKIPIERADLVKEIQIWTQAHQLSAIVKLAARQMRVESFALQNPSRFVVDIFWKTKEQRSAGAIQPAPDDDHTGNASRASGPAQTAPVQQRHEPSDTLTERTITPKAVTAPAERSTLSREEPPTELIPRSESGMAAVSNAAGSDGTSRRANWLQYYLVLALIVLTITILVLLVLMLLTHYRLADNRASLNSNELLRKQKSRIAELDERIKEQLKRYDEA